MITALSQVTYDARQRMASENPSVRLPCCWSHAGEGCVNDASHWVLSVHHGAWRVAKALPVEAKPCAPSFCAQHADQVAAQRNAAKASPVPWVKPVKSKKEKRT